MHTKNRKARQQMHTKNHKARQQLHTKNRKARQQLHTKNRKAREQRIDAVRMEDAAMTAGRSAEALFGYLSRLDALRSTDLHREALADRAAEAELHTRVVLSAGLDALNELNDLGLLNTSPTDEDLLTFNEMKVSEVVVQIAEVFRERMPSQRWDWLESSSRLVEGVDVRVKREKKVLCGTITHSGQSTVFRLDPKAPATRVSTRAFFSNGPDRIYVATSAIFSSTDQEFPPVAAYDAAIGGMAFLREWVYRHARNAAELGPPARTGGGGAIAVIIIILVVVAAVATVAAAILMIVCEGGNDKACRLSAQLGFTATVLNTSANQIDANSGQQRVLTYGTNPQ